MKRAGLLLVVWLGLASGVAQAQIFNWFKKAPPALPPAERVSQLVATVRTSTDERKRVAAVEDLRDFDTKTFPEIIPVLVEAAKADPRPAVRAEAVNTLVRIRPITAAAGQAIEHAAAKDEHWRNRMSAQTALMRYRLAGYSSPPAQAQAPKGKTGEPPLPTPSKEPPLADAAPPIYYFDQNGRPIPAPKNLGGPVIPIPNNRGSVPNPLTSQPKPEAPPVVVTPAVPTPAPAIAPTLPAPLLPVQPPIDPTPPPASVPPVSPPLTLIPNVAPPTGSTSPAQEPVFRNVSPALRVPNVAIPATPTAAPKSAGPSLDLPLVPNLTPIPTTPTPVPSTGPSLDLPVGPTLVPTPTPAVPVGPSLTPLPAPKLETNPVPLTPSPGA